jgi:hypothetical protein
MPDTRIIFPRGAMRGFHPSAGLLNQVDVPAARRIGSYIWRPHVTIDARDAVPTGHKVSTFHVSMYSDDRNWGVFVWRFESRSDRFVCSGFTQATDRLEPIVANREDTLARLLARASTIAGAMNFGAEIEAATWG